mmetsp:Transcript_6966/g.11176  ORF Transcript_6966/g.11176 Transcript_6966/m.11176 type:complete len:90 (-) Transcript_6966:896-1165(-)
MIMPPMSDRHPDKVENLKITSQFSEMSRDKRTTPAHRSKPTGDISRMEIFSQENEWKNHNLAFFERRKSKYVRLNRVQKAQMAVKQRSK